MVSDSSKRKTVLLALLLLAGSSFAGCFGSDDEEEEDDPPFDDGDPNPSAPPELLVSVEDPPTQGLVGDSIQVNVTVAVENATEEDATGGNATGDNATADDLSADFAGIRWTTNSTADLLGENLTATAFDGEAEANESMIPGDFSVTWDLMENGTFFLRAHVEANGTDYWSDEFEVEVLHVVEEGDFDADLEISIVPLASLATYDPDPAEISVGEAVTWDNTDVVAHTATHDADDPEWDTGEIGAGEAAAFSYRFNKAGTYDVMCTVHPEMSAEIVVS